MSDRARAVLEVARSGGLGSPTLVPLRSTNNTAFLLDGCGIVAKVHDTEAAAALELAAGHALAARGAPTVRPAAGIGDHVRTAAGINVTFWDHVASDQPDGSSSTAVAIALHDLHRHLTSLADLVAGRTFLEQLEDATVALERRSFAPQLRPVDRRLLRDALDRAIDVARRWPTTVVHGSPHRFNVLAHDGAAIFADLETIQLGPVEWDLAHLEPEVAAAYPASVDGDRLRVCRTAVSATTATWCWGALERGPDMRAHAEHHLAAVRAAR